ncbi:Os06g0132300, partial [Oryza sativa Japonica Group]
IHSFPFPNYQHEIEISLMFSTARFFLPVRPRPDATISGGRKPYLVAVSARPRRGGSRRNRSWGDGGGDDEDGAADDRIDANFFGDARDEPDPEPEDAAASGRRPSSPAPEQEPAGQLRGSDVLRALERAAAAKEAKRRKRAGARPAARRQDAGERRGGELAAAGAARPIEIRREWATRIRELELRVKQLVDKHHHSPPPVEAKRRSQR